MGEGTERSWTIFLEGHRWNADRKWVLRVDWYKLGLWIQGESHDGMGSPRVTGMTLEPGDALELAEQIIVWHKEAAQRGE